MIMSGDKKKASTLILKKLGDGAESMSEAPMSEDGAELDQSSGFDAAAEEVLQAIESKDAQALKEALRSMVEMCMAEAPEAE